MPIQLVIVSKNIRGYRWGNHGKIYMFRLPATKQTVIKAYVKAERQGIAAHANGYRRY